MSRYILYDDGKLEIAVGWDNPLGTFFYQEIDTEEETDLAWIGAKYGEYPILNKFLSVLNDRHYRRLSDELIQKLQDDQDNAEPLTPLQKMMKERFGLK
jgi:hypothetical protein